MAEITYSVKVQAGVAAADPTKHPAVGDKVLFTAPAGTFLEFQAKGFPFKEAVPPKPIEPSQAAFTFKGNKSKYHVVCGHYVGNKFVPWQGGFDVPG